MVQPPASIGFSASGSGARDTVDHALEESSVPICDQGKRMLGHVAQRVVPLRRRRVRHSSTPLVAVSAECDARAPGP